MKAIRTVLTALVLIGAFASSAWAQSPLTPVTVLAFDATGDLDEAAMEFFNGLRTQIEFHRDFRLNDVPPQSLDELLLAVGCTDLDVSCSQMVGDIVGTQVLAWGEYTVDESTATLSMTLFDLELATEIRTRTHVVPAESRGMLLQNHQVIGRSLLYGSEGSLNIVASEDGAQVFVNGEDMGAAPLHMADIPFGLYAVRVEADGFAPYDEIVVVDIGGATESVVLVAGAVASRGREPRAPRAPRDNAGGSNVGPWVVMGSGVALVAAGVVFGAQKNATQDEFDALVAQPVMDRDEAESLESRGQTQALLSNVGISVGAAALVGGLVWRLARGGQDADTGQTSRPQVNGYAAGDGGGLSVSFGW